MTLKAPFLAEKLNLSQALPCWPRSVTLNFVLPPRPETSEGEAVLNKINRAALEYRGMFCFYKMKQTNKKRSGGKKGIRLHACLCAPRKWSVSIKTQTAAITGKWLDNGEAIALAQLYLSLIFNWLPFMSLFPLNWLIQSPLSLFMKPLFSISIALITCETLFIYFLCLPLFLEGRNPVLFPIVYILSEEQGVRHRADKVSTKLGTSINSE